MKIEKLPLVRIMAVNDYENATPAFTMQITNNLKTIYVESIWYMGARYTMGEIFKDANGKSGIGFNEALRVAPFHNVLKEE